MKKLPGININKPAIKVRHSELQRDGDSKYRSQCPVCKVGLLLMERDRITFQLKETDRCTHCGQSFIYEDIQEIRLK